MGATTIATARAISPVPVLAFFMVFRVKSVR
jgi:hypothetical protein